MSLNAFQTSAIPSQPRVAASLVPPSASFVGTTPASSSTSAPNVAPLANVDPLMRVTSSPQIATALRLMATIQPLPGDLAYLRQMGIEPPFNNGAEALNLILQKGYRVEFGDMGDTTAHAEFRANEGKLIINQRYQNDLSTPTTYGIACAAFHEAGHGARLADDRSSIQEELNCLSLNVIGHRCFAATSPGYKFAASGSRLIKDGVELYANYFFDPDRRKLIYRVMDKYGMLPPQSPDHPIPAITSQTPHPIALEILGTIASQQPGLLANWMA